MLKIKIDQLWLINQHLCVVRCGKNMILTDSSFNVLLINSSTYGGDPTKILVNANYDNKRIEITFRYDDYYTYTVKRFDELPYYDFNYFLSSGNGYLFKVPYTISYSLLYQLTLKYMIFKTIMLPELLDLIFQNLYYVVKKSSKSYELVNFPM